MKDIIKLKEKLDISDIKVKLEKNNNKIVYYIQENGNKIKIGIKGICWKKNNWKEYKLITISRICDRYDLKNICKIKNELVKDLLTIAIQKFF